LSNALSLAIAKHSVVHRLALISLILDTARLPLWPLRTFPQNLPCKITKVHASHRDSKVRFRHRAYKNDQFSHTRTRRALGGNAHQMCSNHPAPDVTTGPTVITPLTGATDLDWPPSG